jgi:hypothetical protein
MKKLVVFAEERIHRSIYDVTLDADAREYTTNYLGLRGFQLTGKIVFEPGENRSVVGGNRQAAELLSDANLAMLMKRPWPLDKSEALSGLEDALFTPIRKTFVQCTRQVVAIHPQLAVQLPEPRRDWATLRFKDKPGGQRRPDRLANIVGKAATGVSLAECNELPHTTCWYVLCGYVNINQTTVPVLFLWGQSSQDTQRLGHSIANMHDNAYLQPLTVIDDCIETLEPRFLMFEVTKKDSGRHRHNLAVTKILDTRVDLERLWEPCRITEAAINAFIEQNQVAVPDAMPLKGCRSIYNLVSLIDDKNRPELTIAVLRLVREHVPQISQPERMFLAERLQPLIESKATDQYMYGVWQHDEEQPAEYVANHAVATIATLQQAGDGQIEAVHVPSADVSVRR